MFRARQHWTCLFGVVLVCACNARLNAQQAGDDSANGDEDVIVRCAVIGGMMDTGFWDEVAARCEKAIGIRSEVVSTGPKHVIAPVYRRGEADLITMHASDTIINLVADGLAVDPQPWARNDLLLVGPADDPAHIRGEADAVRALRKIIAAKSNLLIHPSLGANEVLHDLLAEDALELEPEHTVSLTTDRNRSLLQRAKEANAYTLVGRIPFLNGKISNEGLEIMVAGDNRMRRPYVVAAAPGNEPRQVAARRMAAFLRTPATQAWIKDFGRGALDERPLFFPVVLPSTEKSSDAR
jgi:tungstate transport system substrate-binding protein